MNQLVPRHTPSSSALAVPAASPSDGRHRQRPWRATALALTIAMAGLIGMISNPTAASASIPGCLGGPITGITATSTGLGYELVGTDGGVFNFGNAPFYGSMGGQPLNQKMVGIVMTPDGKGYWEVAADGGEFAYGDATYFPDSLPTSTLNAPIVGVIRHGSTGLWLAAADGGVFALGNAPFYGSMGGKPMNKPVVGIVGSHTGNGYELIGADGGVFAFGDAVAPTNNPLPGSSLNAPIVGATRAGSTNGLWFVASDGGVFAVGAPFYGSMGGNPLSAPVSGIASAPDGAGYWLTAQDGGLFNYGSAGFFGNVVSTNPSCAAPAPPTGTTNAISKLAVANQAHTACGSNSLGGTGYYSSCTGNGGHPEYWCADFAKWAWANTGFNVTNLSAGAYSFYTYGVNHNTNHTAGYTPQVGDAIVYNISGASAKHVGIVTSISRGLIYTENGDFGGDDSGTEAQKGASSMVELETLPTSATIGSYVSSIAMTISAIVTPVR